MMMTKISCCWVWPCSVLYAIAMWPGAGHAFVANGAARSPSDHKAGAAKPGSAGVRPLIMGGGKRCNLDMHWDQVPFFSVEPAASDYLFWRMVGMGADRDDAVRGEPGVEVRDRRCSSGLRRDGNWLLFTTINTVYTLSVTTTILLYYIISSITN